ncbi:helix-turn-helix transcriptional regulator [Burkholderia sp. BCC0405]|uniref:XRE family transcriptional regulator n=1 Tax=Burkholderia sp. BCC0405 TaxID=2676298 RepID=UPI00158941A1|nr:helix-turn-helix transcriptional regulator [Burkholderia sp. BCC0405]
MAYGLDMSQVHYETDEVGNRVRAIVPMKIFTTLTSFWHETRRAQTAREERATRPGLYRSSLGSAVERAHPPPDTSPSTLAFESGGPFDRKWAALLERMPGTDEVHDAAPPGPPVTSTPALPILTDSQRVASPDGVPTPDVATQMTNGGHFLRAWRKYRGWTLRELSELMGISMSSLSRYERNRTRFPTHMLPCLAHALDCSIEQLTAKPGSTPPRLSAVAPQDMLPAVQASNGVSFPAQVRQHLASGKSPVTAWRLYRQLSMTDLAEQYGCAKQGVEMMEHAEHLRAATLEKLARVLRCEPQQLLRPAFMSMNGTTSCVKQTHHGTHVRHRKRTTN